jgi:glycosyltransferase involved in cell wall biosynthesis
MTDKKKLLFIGENSVTDAIRCKLPAVFLSNDEYAEVSYGIVDWRRDNPIPDGDMDAVIFSRPHADSMVMAYKRMGIPVIVDMDDDFHAIPEDHPGYRWVGKGSQLAIDKMENCLYLADHLIVTTDELSDRMQKYLRKGTRTTVIPNGWSSANPHWLSKRSGYTDKVVIGWGGTITHREDFQMCVQPLRRVLREHTDVMVCIAGDPDIYHMMLKVPEKQKLFIPMVAYDEYPITIGYFDIMLAPLINDHFNNAKSDIKLIDAGAMGIPYIASNMPVYKAWFDGDGNKAGLITSDDQWYENIKYLVQNKEIREKMGKAGKGAVKKRDMINLGNLWRDTIEEVIEANKENLR